MKTCWSQLHSFNVFNYTYLMLPVFWLKSPSPEQSLEIKNDNWTQIQINTTCFSNVTIISTFRTKEIVI